MTLDRAASDANVAVLTAWARERGLELAPHGKTTMSPELWHRLLDAGCWGITLATPWQVQVARSAGIDRIILANELADPVAIDWLSAELDAHPAFEFACWVDSVEGVALLAASTGSRPIDVLVELGAEGGRTGARGADAARAVADAAAASPRLRLRGVAGYEGSYGSTARATACAGTCASSPRCSRALADRFARADHHGGRQPRSSTPSPRSSPTCPRR